MNKKQEEKTKNNKDQLKESQEKFGVTKINFLEVISESYQTCLKNLKQSFIRLKVFKAVSHSSRTRH